MKQLIKTIKKIFGIKEKPEAPAFIPFGKNELVDIRNEVTHRMEIVNKLFVRNSTIGFDSLAMYQIVAHDLELMMKAIAPLSGKKFYLYNDKLLTDASIDHIEFDKELQGFVATSLAPLDPDARVPRAVDLIKKTDVLTVDDMIEKYGYDAFYTIGKFRVVEV